MRLEMRVEVSVTIEDHRVDIEFFIACFEQSMLTFRKLLHSHFLSSAILCTHPNKSTASSPQKFNSRVTFRRSLLTIDFQFFICWHHIRLLLFCRRYGLIGVRRLASIVLSFSCWSVSSQMRFSQIVQLTLHTWLLLILLRVHSVWRSLQHFDFLRFKST